VVLDSEFLRHLTFLAQEATRGADYDPRTDPTASPNSSTKRALVAGLAEE
jgi:hypothetical protein